MKFSLSFELFGKKKPAAENKETAEAEQKSGGSWGKLWPLGLEWLITGRSSATKPFEQNPNVYKAISAIATNIPQAEIGFFKTKTNEQIEDENLDRLFYRPNPYESWNDFIECVAGHFAASGEYFIVMEKSVGQVAGTSKLPSQLWTDESKAFKEIIDQKTGLLTGWEYKSGRKFALEEVIHGKTFNLYSRWRGASPLVVVDGEVQLDYKAMEYNKRFMDNDATPGFSLTTEKNLTPDQRARLEKWAEQRNKGVENAGKMNIFDGGLTPNVLSKSHKDMEFLEQRGFAREEILGTFKTPKALFNITEALNYATFTGQMKIFWIYCLVPILRKIEEGINYRLIDPYNSTIHFAFKLDNVPAFQEDFKDKVTTGKTLWDMGFTRNEINQKLNLGFEDKDWGDYWWIGFGQVPADAEAAAASLDLPDDEETEDDDAGDDKKSRGKKSASYKKWQTFLQKQAPTEKLFLVRMRHYFMDVRSEVLKNLAAKGKNATADTVADWPARNEDIVKRTTPLIRQAANDGVEVGQSLVGKKSSVAEEQLRINVENMVKERAKKITGINSTLKKQIRLALEKGLDEGDTINELAERIRGVFNFASSRAVTIARTESAGAVNGGSALYYEQAGVKLKEWITAGDELVRDSHLKVDTEKVEPTDKFSNGLYFPGDPNAEASEVINCRCTIAPVD